MGVTMEFWHRRRFNGLEHFAAFCLPLFLASPCFSQPNSTACIAAKERSASLLEQQQEARVALSSDECAGPARTLCSSRLSRITNDIRANASVVRTVCDTRHASTPTHTGPPPVEGWFDAMTGQPAPSPLPYDLVTRTFDPDNGLPLNPALGSQTRSPVQLADPSLCLDPVALRSRPYPIQAACTNQGIRRDSNPILHENTNDFYCPVGTTPGLAWPLSGHVNWKPVIVEGTIQWGNHSFVTQDDDYSFALIPYDIPGVALPGVTKQDVDRGEYLHSEFDSSETINHFHSWYWDVLHKAVDDDAGVGGICNVCPRPSYDKTRAIFNDKEAIVIGLYGLDCAHGCGAELHPVYALAIHIKNDANDDTWAIFVRNWGNEGYCSSHQEELNPGAPLTLYVRLKRPGATGVEMINEADPQGVGEHGTVFYGNSNNNGNGVGWYLPSLINDEGAIVGFTLPQPEDRGYIHGMLHLKWTLPLQRTATGSPGRRLQTVHIEDHEDARGEFEPAGPDSHKIAKMTTQQKAKLYTLYKTLQGPQQQDIRLAPKSIPPGAVMPIGKISVMKVPDPTQISRRQQILNETLKIKTPRQ